MSFLYQNLLCKCSHKYNSPVYRVLYKRFCQYSTLEHNVENNISEDRASSDASRFFHTIKSYNRTGNVLVSVSPLYDSPILKGGACFMKPVAYGFFLSDSDGDFTKKQSESDNFHFVYSNYLDGRFNEILSYGNLLWISHGCKNLLNSFHSLDLNKPNLSQLFDTLTISNIVQFVQRETSLQKTFIEARRNIRKAIQQNKTISEKDEFLLNYELPPEIGDLFLGRFGSKGWGNYHYTKKDSVTFEPLNDSKLELLLSEDKLPNFSKKRKFNILTEEDLRLYSLNRTRATHFLYMILCRMMEELPNAKTIWEKLERPLLDIFSQMERRGVFVDSDKVKTLQDTLPNPNDFANDIFDIVGYELNLKSSSQVATMIYDILMLPSPYQSHELEMNETKFRSTSNTTLNMMIKNMENNNGKGKNAVKLEVLKNLIEYRKAIKAHRVYAESLPSYKSIETDRIHCTFNQTGTVTGRISCSNPNLQNIHKDFKTMINAGQQIENEYQIVTFDYNKMELFILAYLSLDSVLLNSLQSEDVFSSTAARIFDMDEKSVTLEHRRVAKTITYGIMYGQSKLGLSRTLQVEVGYAGDLIKKFFSNHPRVYDFMSLQRDIVKKHNKSETLAGRTRIIPATTVNKKSIAMNTPIQGCAADVMKYAIQHADRSISSSDIPIDARLILQVHDELVYECRYDNITELAGMVKPIMESSLYNMINELNLEENYMNTLREIGIYDMSFSQVLKIVNNFHIPVSYKSGTDYL